MKAKPPAPIIVHGLSCRDHRSRCMTIYATKPRCPRSVSSKPIYATRPPNKIFCSLLFEMFDLRGIVLILISSIVAAKGNPKFDDGGFVPSSMVYLEKNAKSRDQIAMPSQVELRSETSTKRGDTESNDIAERSQDARFGFTNLGTTGSGYGVSSYAPTKIDLGGLLLGAIIGIGSILIIPKLLYVLSGTYGHYARSEESGFTQIMTKLDDVLARHGIDTTSCMQRAVCTYSQQAAASIREGSKSSEEKVSSFDRMIETVTTNQIFRTAMEGTAIQEAIEAGRNGRTCSRIYSHCGFSMETMLSLLSNVIATVSTVNADVTSPTGTGTL